MIDEYRKYAKLYFAEREEMLRAYRALPQKEFDRNGAAAAMAAVTEKCAFMLRVFTELGLIEPCGSGRIHAIKAPKKELRQSVTYRSFEYFIKGSPKS